MSTGSAIAQLVFASAVSIGQNVTGTSRLFCVPPSLSHSNPETGLRLEFSSPPVAGASHDPSATVERCPFNHYQWPHL